MTYKHILAALDLSDDSAQVCRRATALARKCNARLSILHVVEYVPVEPMGEALLPGVHVEEELVEGATSKLAALMKELGLQEASTHTRVGTIKSEIVHFAAEHECDLIVIGSHERHGVSILVNLTEDTVLHKAKCDVLAVRLTQ